MLVDVKCSKCEKQFVADIGDKTVEAFKESLKDQRDFECPGHHVELSSPSEFWTVLEGTLREGDAHSEEEFLKDLQEKNTAENGEIRVWDTEQLTQVFEVKGFCCGTCDAVHKLTGNKVVLNFIASPKGKRYYYPWQWF